MLKTVKVPAEMQDAFARAEELVARFFADRREMPERGTIELGGERYVLVRAAGLSIDFFHLVRKLYGEGREIEADQFSLHILFDLAHALGKSDAQRFAVKMNITDPIERLSAGPTHFARAGWAFVDIHPESHPTPDEDYFLLYDHPYSFESDEWRRAGVVATSPICIMNAGYSSGWCEESFGVELVAAELTCRARGDAHCRFVMAPPSRIERHVERLVRTDRPVIPDFFARKRMEEELRRARAELEDRVRERTEELRREMESRQQAERRLLQRDKLEALGRLAGGVAHDFNNLTAIVLVNSRMLARSFAPDDPRRKLIDEIAFASERASELTRQLLAFGRAQPSEPGTLDPNAVIADLARLLERVLGDGVELRLELAPEVGHVLAERGRFEQVVVNLAVNARDAMPHGGVLHIATSRAAPAPADFEQLELAATDRGYVLLDVRDTGTGMDDATRAAMFDPFFTTKQNGGGLGLSTVHGIVREAGGAIAVDSHPGRGTTVRVFLPVTEVVPARVAAPPAVTTERVRGAILLVEDQEVLRQALERELRELEHEVTAVSGVDEALAAARARRFDLVISDIMLPRSSGNALADALVDEHPGIKVLLMSGGAIAPHTRAQEVEFLAKPFTADALEQTIARLLAR